MKDVLSTCLCQTLLILFFKFIAICHAVDLSESDHLVQSFYEEPNNNNRRRYYGDTDTMNRANHYYETANTNSERPTNQQNNLIRTGGETKFTKPESRETYDTGHGYTITRNSDDEIGIDSVGSAENDDSIPSIQELGLTNNTAFGATAIMKSNFPNRPHSTTNTDSCSCGDSDEVSFLCFSTRDGNNNLNIKYKGTILFDIEDIIKGYKYYFDKMQVYNFKMEDILTTESNFKQEFEGGGKFNIDISKYKINDGNFNLNAESKFDITGDGKFKVNAFDNFDVNTIKEDSNKFNFDFIKNAGLDIQKYFHDKNFKTQFEKLPINAKMEAWKKIQEMIAESKTNGKFSLNNNLEVQADAQAQLEAHAKALAEVKAKAKAQAMFEAQAKADLKAQAMFEAQAKADLKAQAMFEAQAEADLKAQLIAQSQAEADLKAQLIAQSQADAQAQAMAQAQIQAEAQASGSGGAYFNKYFNLGIGGEKKGIFGNGGFNLGFNGGLQGMTKFGKKTGGKISFSGGASASGKVGMGARMPYTGKTIVSGNDGQGMGTSITYTDREMKYGDDLYDDGFEYSSYPGVHSVPVPNDSPVNEGRLYKNSRIDNDGLMYGDSGYQRYL